MNIYYKIWVDCIVKARSIPTNKNNWKRFTMALMTAAMAINFAIIMSILQKNILGKYFYHFKVDFFPGTKLDALISGFTLFGLPMLLLNYFLIFRNNRYEELLKNTNHITANYFLFTFFLLWQYPYSS
jgi:hypothetical protein